jgi:hypothetical protein
MRLDIGKLLFPSDRRSLRRRKMRRLVLWTAGSVALVGAIVFLMVYVSGGWGFSHSRESDPTALLGGAKAAVR